MSKRKFVSFISLLTRDMELKRMYLDYFFLLLQFFCDSYPVHVHMVVLSSLQVLFFITAFPKNKCMENCLIKNGFLIRKVFFCFKRDRCVKTVNTIDSQDWWQSSRFWSPLTNISYNSGGQVTLSGPKIIQNQTEKILIWLLCNRIQLLFVLRTQLSSNCQFTQILRTPMCHVISFTCLVFTLILFVFLFYF